MAQRRYFNWEDNDSTNWLNRADMGVFGYGVYRGYDAVLAAGLTLVLDHSTSGYEEVDGSLNHLTNLGLLRTKQGTRIIEDAALPVAIAANPNGDPRIDLIVCEHTYVQVTGGAVAIYKAIQGTPAANPVAPALTQWEKQTIIGSLYCPAGMASLTDAGVVWTKSPIPYYANDPTVMHTDQVQTSIAHKSFNSFSGAAVPNLVYNAGDNSLTATVASNFYYLPFQNVAEITIKNLRGAFTTMPLSQPVFIFTNQRLRLNVDTDQVDDGVILWADDQAQEKTIADGEGIILVKQFSQQWAVYSGGQADKNAINKYNFGQLFGKYGTAATINGSGNLSLGAKAGNYLDVTIATPNQHIARIPTSAAFGVTPILEAGSFLFLNIKGNNAVLEHNATLSGSNKPLVSPTLADIPVSQNDVVLLIEDNTGWRIVSVFEGFKNWLANTFEGSVLSLIRTKEHSYTKIQAWGQVAITRASHYDHSLERLVLPPNGNEYNLNVLNTDQPINIKDIVIDYGGGIGITPAPTGMLLVLTVNPNISNPIRFFSNVNGAADANGHPTSTTGIEPFIGMADGSGNLIMAVPQLDDRKYVYVFERTATKWRLVSCNQQIQWEQLLHALEIGTLKSSVNSVYVNDYATTNWAGTGGGLTVTNGWMEYRKLNDKTIVCNYQINFNVVGTTLTAIRYPFPAGFNRTGKVQVYGRPFYIPIPFGANADGVSLVSDGNPMVLVLTPPVGTTEFQSGPSQMINGSFTVQIL